MKEIIPVLLAAALLAVLAYPGALAIDAVYGADVYLLSSVNDDGTIQMNRELYAYTSEGLSGDEQLAAVIEIYGSSPKPEIERVLLWGDAAVIRPAELPGVAFLPAGSAGGEYPAQTQSLLYVTKSVSLAALAAALVLFMLLRLVVRRQD